MGADMSPFPPIRLIRGTFDLMLREVGNRGTALRLTCRDLGLSAEVVRDAVIAREAGAAVRDGQPGRA
jgi:hypothetical protein